MNNPDDKQEPKKKATQAEVRKRVDEVLTLRLAGAEFHDIVQYASAPERNWNVSERQLWNYIAAADALCKDRFDAKADYLLARHLMQRRALYAHAMGLGDYRTALAVLKDEAELEALYPPPKAAPLDGFPGPDSLATAGGLVEMLARTIAAVGCGELEGKVAGTIGSLTGTLLHAIETASVEQRLAALEQQAAAAKRK